MSTVSPPVFVSPAQEEFDAVIPSSTPSRSYFKLKGSADCIAALAMLIPALPLIGAIVILIRLTSKGPGIYWQTRVGKGGRIFTMYKLRSMRMDAESNSGPVWASVNNDPRVTPLGYWLRRLHLDELPQLFNVLLGDMSLVGPRPERPEFVCVLGEQVPGYLERLRVAPGITGLAQVNLPPDTDLDSVRRKIVLDREYIATAGLLLDARLVLCTMLRVFGLRSGRALSLLGLQRRVDLPIEIAPTGGLPNGPPITPSVVVNDKEGSSQIHSKAKHSRRGGSSQILKAR